MLPPLDLTNYSLLDHQSSKPKSSSLSSNVADKKKHSHPSTQLKGLCFTHTSRASMPHSHPHKYFYFRQKRNLCEFFFPFKRSLFGVFTALTGESLRGGAKAGCSAPIGCRIVAGSWAGLSPRQTKWPRAPAGPRSVCSNACNENVWMHWGDDNDNR